MSIEFGPNGGQPDFEAPRQTDYYKERKPSKSNEAEKEIVTLTSTWKELFPHVYTDQKSSELLQRLINIAKKHAEDGDWYPKLKELQSDLENTDPDDEDAIRDAIESALGESAEDDEDDDLDDIEEDEEE
jgi:hypothetical protein